MLRRATPLDPSLRFATRARRHAQARFVLDTLFPPRCVGCDARGAWICLGCQAKIQAITKPLCGVCNNPLVPSIPHGCATHRVALRSITAIGGYDGPLRAAVHALKYEGRHAIGATLAGLLAPRLASRATPSVLLVPVPLHPTRERERGYNQAAVVARELTYLLPLDLDARALRRVRATQDQTLLDGTAARAANVRGAFIASPSAVRGRVVWLVDDVCTTGATLHAAAMALRHAGADQVHAVVVAKTVFAP